MRGCASLRVVADAMFIQQRALHILYLLSRLPVYFWYVGAEGRTTKKITVKPCSLCFDFSPLLLLFIFFLILEKEEILFSVSSLLSKWLPRCQEQSFVLTVAVCPLTMYMPV